MICSLNLFHEIFFKKTLGLPSRGVAEPKWRSTPGLGGPGHAPPEIFFFEVEAHRCIFQHIIGHQKLDFSTD